MDIGVFVEGVSDRRIAKRIERAVHAVAKKEARSGEWRVLVAPSETRGEWDVGVRSPGAHHFGSFRAEPEELPQLVDLQFRAALATPASSAENGWR